jgi:hypothetical protein
MRDEHGNFLKAYTIKKHGTPVIAEAEALGIREALTWIKNNYEEATTIEVESDCLQAVQAINSGHTNYTEFGSIIRFLAQSLQVSIFLNIHRVCIGTCVFYIKCIIF